MKADWHRRAQWGRKARDIICDKGGYCGGEAGPAMKVDRLLLQWRQNSRLPLRFQRRQAGRWQEEQLRWRLATIMVKNRQPQWREAAVAVVERGKHGRTQPKSTSTKQPHWGERRQALTRNIAAGQTNGGGAWKGGETSRVSVQWPTTETTI